MTREEAWDAFKAENDDLSECKIFLAGWDAAIESLEEPKEKIPYHEIVEYLNECTGKNFKKVNTTKERIHARWAEGFRLDDFKHVIKSKCDQWIRDPKMSVYLRPETLFGTKFDSYLNETPKIRSAIEEWQ